MRVSRSSCVQCRSYMSEERSGAMMTTYEVFFLVMDFCDPQDCRQLCSPLLGLGELGAAL